LARAAIFRIDFGVAPRGVCATSDRNNATTTITIITTASAGPNDILKDNLETKKIDTIPGEKHKKLQRCYLSALEKIFKDVNYNVFVMVFKMCIL